MKQAALQALQHVRTTLAYQLTPEAVSELLEPIQRVLEADEHGGKTGWPAGLLQDDCRELSGWLSTRPDARRMVREACADIDSAAAHNAKVDAVVFALWNHQEQNEAPSDDTVAAIRSLRF